MYDDGMMADELLSDDGPDVDTTDKHAPLYVVKPMIVATLKNGPLWLQIFDAPQTRPIWSPTLRITRTRTPPRVTTMASMSEWISTRARESRLVTKPLT